MLKRSTAIRQSTKSAPPRKPHAAYPLFAHQVGQWAKKIKGKTLYFGVWADPEGALKKWLAEKDELLAGRVPRNRKAENTPTLRDLCNAFPTTKATMRDSGELSVHTWRDYLNVCEYLSRPSDPTAC
jgi:hypothetical protein